MKSIQSELRKEMTLVMMMELKPNYTYLGKKYNLDPRTVKKYYEGYEGKPVNHNKHSKIEKFDKIIDEKLSLPGVKISAIYFFLKEKFNYSGSYSNLTYYIRKNKKDKCNKTTETHVRYETDPGEVIQFDWVEDITLINSENEIFNFNVFSAELVYSRMHFFCYSKFKTKEDVYRCLIKTFKFFGGVSHALLTDNMSSIVDTVHLKFYNEFLVFAKDVGTNPNKCKVKHPFTKGKVEVRNKFIKWLVPFNCDFETEEDIMKIIEKINIQVNNKINSTTNMKPILLYNKEKEYLNPLPSIQIMEQYMNLNVAVKIHNTSLFDYKGKQYSVPTKYINKTLKVKEIDNKLYVYDNTDLVTIHNISNNKINYLKEHYIEGLKNSMPDKNIDEIETLAQKNLNLLSQITNGKKENE